MINKIKIKIETRLLNAFINENSSNIMNADKTYNFVQIKLNYY